MSDALKAMLARGKVTVDEGEPPAAAVPGPAREERRSFGSKLRPSLHRYLKSSVLDFEDQLGRGVKIEDVLEVLITQLRDDPALRREVLRLLREGMD